MSTDERLLSNLCDFRERGFSEKQWVGLNGVKLDWNNFAQKSSEQYAQTIPEFVKNGIKSTLKVSSYVSGRDSFPPPMGAMISFDYYENSSIGHFRQIYIIHINGDLIEDTTGLYAGSNISQLTDDIHGVRDYQNFLLVSVIGIPILAVVIGFVAWNRKKSTV
ncbi:MAG: hypothetical protein EPO62_06340 [Candidatus Nitrosotenuis sp.]|nr:MAG: hypothetical protein EPO62_06340 [Candidatus Nitrosotenuis sp.]